MRGSVNGVVVMNISLWELGRQLSHSKIYITDNKIILYSTNKNEIGQPVTTINNYSQIVSNNNFTEGSVNVSSKTSGETGLTVISYLDAQSYKNNLYKIKNNMYLFIVIMVFITILLCYFILSNVNQRLKLYFGEEFGVLVSANDDMGIDIRLTFPRVE